MRHVGSGRARSRATSPLRSTSPVPARTSGSPHRSPVYVMSATTEQVEDVDPLDSAAEGELPRSWAYKWRSSNWTFQNSPATYIRSGPDDNGAAAVPTAPTVFLSMSLHQTYATASTTTKST